MSEKNDSTNETRLRILEAALETVFQEKISGTSIGRIADQAGVSKGHLNYYFATKQALLAELLLYLLDKFLQDREPVLSDPDLAVGEKLSKFFEQKITFIEEKRFQYVLYDYWAQGTTDQVLQQTLRDSYVKWRSDINRVIQQGIDQGVWHTDHKELIAPLLIAILDGAALQYMLDPQAFDLEGFMRFAQTMIETALSCGNQ